MIKSNSYFSRVLCALLLCAGLVVAGCTDDPLGDEQNTEQGGNGGGSQDKPTDENEVTSGPATITIDKITATTVTFKGKIDVAEADRDFSIVTVRYSEPDGFSAINEKLPKVSTTSFDANGDFTIVLDKLSYNTTYKYCVIAKVRTEETYSDKVMSFTTGNVLVSVSAKESTIFSKIPVAEFTGIVTGLFEEDKSDVEVGVAYYTASEGLMTNSSTKVAATSVISDGTFELSKQLSVDTKYYYCSYIRQNSKYVYGDEIKELQTLGVYSIPSDLNISSAIDLSSPAPANCYIVSNGGLYKFKVVKGNSLESVGNVAFASILWESFGTSDTPELFALIKAFCYKDGYIAFQTADTFKEGNAVIAAKDAFGTILWSWHIWLTDQPQGQVYYNNAGIMMDRNLGATSATPGDVGALGLLYQWGRKDPFLGSWSISSWTLAESTITWPSVVESNSSNGTIAYATANPTTFITYNSSNHDWYYTGSKSIDKTRWTTLESTKSIYDPCPVGWRVPDGGRNGVWSKACGSSSDFEGYPYNSTSEGMNFSGKFGSASTIWYPAAGDRGGSDGVLRYVASFGSYWSASPNDGSAHYLYFGIYDDVGPSKSGSCAQGRSVRCLQE